MSNRRILSLWFPRLAAERVLRQGVPFGPFAIVREEANAQVLSALSAEAEAAGVQLGQPVRDARAMCPELRTQAADPEAEAAFLAALRRWAGRFSPWVAEEAPASLIVDLTGCAQAQIGTASGLPVTPHVNCLFTHSDLFPCRIREEPGTN